MTSSTLGPLVLGKQITNFIIDFATPFRKEHLYEHHQVLLPLPSLIIDMTKSSHSN